VRGVDHELGTVGTVEVVIGVNPLLSEIRDAIAERQAIAFTYQGRRRQLLPYVIGMWRNRWYVHGFDPERDATRNFRLDRIGIETTGDAITPHGEPGSYEIPPDIVPEVVFRMDPNAWGEDPPLDAVIRVEADAIPSFLDEFAEAEEWQRSLSGAVFRIRVRHYDSFLIRLIGLGTTVRLVEPEVLVARLRKWLRAQVEEA
jgi:predicted DNA-binding transcriptional regulator YafY